MIGRLQNIDEQKKENPEDQKLNSYNMANLTIMDMPDQ